MIYIIALVVLAGAAALEWYAFDGRTPADWAASHHDKDWGGCA